MNKEHHDEREAKLVVERVLGIELRHADKDGGVDYLSSDGCHAVEVTRVTDGRKRAGRDALQMSRDAGTSGELQTCWLAVASDTQQGLKTFRQRVHSALVELELAGETLFRRQRAAVHVIKKGPLSHIYQPLLVAGVERATAAPDHAHRSQTHRVIPSLGGGGTLGGSDQALRLLTDALSEKKDNPKKLKASGAEHRHLFVWLDDDTRFDIARPLSREAPAWHDGFGIPSTPPALDPAITRLWVIHQGSRKGWLWAGESKSWRGLSDNLESSATHSSLKESVGLVGDSDSLPRTARPS